MARDNIVTFRVTDDELDAIAERADHLGYDQRAEYCRDSVLGRTRGDYGSEYGTLAERVQTLENVVGTSTSEHEGASAASTLHGDGVVVPNTNEYVEGVDLPSTVDTSEANDAVRACVDYLREHGSATKKKLVTNVMPQHSLGYDVGAMQDKMEAGERYRGAWWRKVVKPALGELERVEKPTSSRSDWRWVG